MKLVKSCLVLAAIALFLQGCAATPDGDRPASRTRLADLGNGICRESSGRMWQVERSEVFASGQEAHNYTKNVKLGNYSDWRLPSREELYELCRLIELRLAGDCPIQLKGGYWLANGGATEAGEWEAYPLCGGPGFRYAKSKSGRVKAVRP